MTILTSRNELVSMIQARDAFLDSHLRMDASSATRPRRTSGNAFTAASAARRPTRAGSLEEIVVGAGVDVSNKTINVYLRESPDGMSIPARIGDFPACYVTSGVFRAAVSSALTNPRRRCRPARPGRSIGPPSETAGTLGAWVQSGDKVYALSAGHVLTDFGKFAPGAVIRQPGLLDQPDVLENNVIAKLSQASALDPSPAAENRLDAALAEVVNGGHVGRRFLAPIGRLRGCEHLPPRRDLEVQKIGRTTGHRRGRVTDCQVTVKVEFDGQPYRFVDQIFIEGLSDPFATGGDSGALVLGRRSTRPIALLMAVSDTGITVANRFDLVQKTLGFTLLV